MSGRRLPAQMPPLAVMAWFKAVTAEGSLGTTTEHLAGLTESDCAIEHGDSGGPLVTTSGKVLGTDTAASTGQGYSLSGATSGFQTDSIRW
jgi:S1-C subfamily serine protease